MPSKQDICVVPETMAKPKDYFRSDIEDLVSAIAHSLKLKSQPYHSVCSKQKRVSPYSVPVRTLSRRDCDKENESTEHSAETCKYCKAKSKSSVKTADEPYEVLQSLIRDGSLIKEAVKRLRKGGSHSTKLKNASYYDSDEYDGLSPAHLREF